MTTTDSPGVPLDLVLQALVDRADRQEHLLQQVLLGQAALAGRLALLEDALGMNETLLGRVDERLLALTAHLTSAAAMPPTPSGPAFQV